MRDFGLERKAHTVGSKDTANVAVALHNTFLEELESMRDLI